YHRGVRVVGGDFTRQLASDGTVSVFGTMHVGIDVDTTPRLTAEQGQAAIAAAVNGQARGGAPELVVLPLNDGYHLAYFGQATTDLEVLNVYVDASSGALLRRSSDFIKDVGLGKGTYGDNKKVSSTAVSGSFAADDKLRPASITTYDMKGSLSRANLIL